MEKYIFTSYSHLDMAKVESIIRALHRQKFHVWYDKNSKAIPPNIKWEDYLDQQLRGAEQCIFFMSRDSVLRPQVIRELRLMLKLQKEIVTIMLEEVPFSKISDEKLRNYFQQHQVMKVHVYGGINRAFVNALMKELKEECREENAPPLELSNIALYEDGKSYVYEDGKPSAVVYQENGESYEYYRLTLSDVSPMAVFPCATDNQWYPEIFYRQEMPREEAIGFRQKMQRNEIIQALLHYQQVLLNRAFLLNTSFLYDCYWKKSENYSETEEQALAELLETGAICVYLMKEESPVQFAEFDMHDDVKKAWKDFCKVTKIHSVKLEWDEEANENECSRRLSIPFYEFCVTLCDNPMRIDSLIEALEIPQKMRPAFVKRLIRVRKRVIKKGFSYTRNQFYMDFVTKKWTNVSDSVISKRKPFALELKKIADLKYNCNFADACQCILKEPEGTLQRAAFMENNVRTSMYQNEMKFEELSFAISEFSAKFSADKKRVPKVESITFAMLAKLRKNNQAWIEYIAALEVMSKRANQWAIDFNPMEELLALFDEVVAALKVQVDEKNCVELDSAVSIIYQIDNQRIVTVYNYTENKLYYTVNDKKARVGLSPIRISFRYGDALNLQISDTISSEIFFYQGTADISGLRFAEKIINYLENEGFEVRES